ncbi:MAG: MarC family protein [Thermoguttaceae bacterium]|nr:MarC family protein [Thermoguttaceae bacterium]MDW8080070.1 MarC family protein [Thermoguttaceae bacterium]
MREFWLCFVPLFVAVDAVGILPIFLGLTAGLPLPRRRRIVKQSVATAGAVGVGFLFLGQGVLRLLGITVADFMIAGGLLLLALATLDLLIVSKQPHPAADPETLGAVPIGVPLICGPAVLTTTLLLANQFGWLWTSLALIVNLLLAGIILWHACVLERVLGNAGSRTVSKVACVLLAAFAVMMIRKGVYGVIAENPWPT